MDPTILWHIANVPVYCQALPLGPLVIFWQGIQPVQTPKLKTWIPIVVIYSRFILQVHEGVPGCNHASCPTKHQLLLLSLLGSKKPPTGPTERTPKPEYLIALATYLGVRW